MGKVKAGDLVVLVAAGLVDMLAQHFAQGFLHQVGSGVVAADGSAALFIHSSGYGIAYADGAVQQGAGVNIEAFGVFFFLTWLTFRFAVPLVR